MTTTTNGDPIPGRYFGRLVLHPLDAGDRPAGMAKEGRAA